MGSSRIYERLSDFAGRRSDLIRKVVVRFDQKSDLKNLVDSEAWHRGLDPTITFTPDEYRRLRKREDSRNEMSPFLYQKLLPESPVDDDRIRRFEQGRNTKVPNLRSRLDSVYGADGRTCWEPVTAERMGDEESRISFPPYWVGPVTLSACKVTGTGDPVQTITIRWGEWETKVLLASDTTMTLRRCTKNDPPIEVMHPAGWEIRAGIGYDASSFDINTGWHPTTPEAKLHLFERLKPIYLQLFERTPEDFGALEQPGIPR